ncbi:MAG: SGNH/GDSL hydrolase family protein [Clostridia bacterium]|nr:SGNH/GDSL hydrolase family protein [Clostridia bacterium]
MSDISTIDKNLKITESFGRSDIVLYDAKNTPFSLYGVFCEGGIFRRMPKAAAERVSENVAQLSENTSGGRVCFSTDSECIALTCTRPGFWAMGHMARTGIAGFSLYERVGGKWLYLATFVPPATPGGFSSIVDLPGGKKMRELMLQMPLYAPISTLQVGVAAGSALGEWKGGYTHKKPIVFYGSSITQGGCASTPGGDYAGRLSRRFDADYINLGFSGSAKGERAMMEYIAGLDISVFVYDYDYNAPDAEHLRRTHYAGYRTVREAQPKLPIIIMSAPNYDRIGYNAPERRDIIAETYARARAEGDENVYFVDGKVHFATFNAEECTVDGCHPNDLGFRRMADAVGTVLEGILG